MCNGNCFLQQHLMDSRLVLFFFFLIESSDEDDASGDEGLLDDDSVSICGPKLSLSPQIIKLHIF